MRWCVCMKNLEVGKMQLITPDMRVDEDDPRYGEDVHIVPAVEDPKDSSVLTFGVHDFIRECYCHPRIEEQCFGRTLVVHQTAVH